MSRAGRPSVAGVEPGEKLLAGEKLGATGAPMGAVIQALRGKPGSTRRLRLEREGKAFTVRATVIRLP